MPCACSKGHPIDILLKILTSTGDGTNGPFDKYPRSWGLGVPIELISEAAFNQARRILQLSSGNYHWRLLIEQEQADPSTFISQIFNPAGIWLCVRQGQIICRLARDMHKAGLQRQPEDLFDGDLLEVPVVHWYPTDQPQTYFRALVIRWRWRRDSFSRSSTSTLPVKEEVSYDLTAVFQSINRNLDLHRHRQPPRSLGAHAARVCRRHAPRPAQLCTGRRRELYQQRGIRQAGRHP